MTSARLALVRRKVRTYRVAFSDLAGKTGVAVELIGAANKLITLRHIQIDKPTVAHEPYQLEKLSTACTVGTSTTPTPVPTRTSMAAADGVVKLYTVAPTKGTLIDQIQEIDIGTGDTLNENYGDGDSQSGAYRLEAAAQVLVIVINADSTMNGYIEWEEEP